MKAEIFINIHIHEVKAVFVCLVLSDKLSEVIWLRSALPLELISEYLCQLLIRKVTAAHGSYFMCVP